MSNNQNFDPVYAALASLLIAACTVSFTAQAISGNAVLTGIPSTSALTPGLAVAGDPGVSLGNQIHTVDGPNQITLIAPINTQGQVSLTAGFSATDPVSCRLLRHWNDVQPPQMPAFFLAQGDEIQEKRTGQPGKWSLDPMAYVYAYAPDDKTPPVLALNALLGAIRGAMGPDRSGPGAVQFRQTLGGLAFDAWINGKIETDGGYLGQLAVAKVPVRIIVNGP